MAPSRVRPVRKERRDLLPPLHEGGRRVFRRVSGTASERTPGLAGSRLEETEDAYGRSLPFSSFFVCWASVTSHVFLRFHPYSSRSRHRGGTDPSHSGTQSAVASQGYRSRGAQP